MSFVDSGWLTAGLMVVRQTFPELAARAAPLIDRADFRFFYDEARGRMRHGYWVHTRMASRFHYGVFYAESRLGELRRDRQGRRPRGALVRDGAHVSRRLRLAAPAPARASREDGARPPAVRRLVRVAGRPLRAVLGWKPLRSAHADAGARRARARAREPRRERHRARDRAAPVRRDAPHAGVGLVVVGDARPGRLRRARRAGPRHDRLSARRGDAARLGAGAGRRSRPRHREPAHARRPLSRSTATSASTTPSIRGRAPWRRST